MEKFCQVFRGSAEALRIGQKVKERYYSVSFCFFPGLPLEWLSLKKEFFNC